MTSAGQVPEEPVLVLQASEMPATAAPASQSLAEASVAVFAADGPLAQRLRGYRPRAQQQDMARAVAEALASHGTLVAEAGTGTGKTYAYLAPALLRGGKVLVSTGTKPLQDQLFERDLPALVQALGKPVSIALLKGRGNYVCHYHMQRLADDERGLPRHEWPQLRRIQQFAKISKSGDKAGLAEIPDTAPIWDKVTSTRENCLGNDCPNYRDCFVVKARKQAQESEVVVINHALFMADLVLREEGIAELLPQADSVIFDEAHQLPGVATRFLGETVSAHQLIELARDARAAGVRHSPESADWVALSEALEHTVRELRLACTEIQDRPGQRSAFDVLPDPDAFADSLAQVYVAVLAISRCLNAVREREPELEVLARRAPAILGRLQRWPAARAQVAQASLPGLEAVLADLPLALGEALAPEAPAGDASPAGTAANPEAADAKPDAQAPAEVWVRWVEASQQHLRLQAAPLSVARAFSQCRPKGQAWVFTSATLSVRRDFTHFTQALGLYDLQTGQWPSPFDYPTQGRLLVPHGLPEPSHPGFTDAFADLLVPLLEASQGSALILCTTLRAVDRVASRLAAVFAEKGWDWPLLRQGDRSRGELLASLRTQPHAVLVGSASFWEGIDVPGDALTLVAIDKLPFAPPDDPVIEARIRACRENGGNPFVQFQLPQAAIALKQGGGRLIRTERDWGVLVVGDRRLVEKPYGGQLWRGLPPFGRTRSVQEAVDFLVAGRLSPPGAAELEDAAEGNAESPLVATPAVPEAPSAPGNLPPWRDAPAAPRE